MSLLKTKIPVDVRRVIDALPKDAHVHSIVLNNEKSAVEIVWDTPTIRTPYTFPVDHPLEKLLGESQQANPEVQELLAELRRYAEKYPLSKMTKAAEKVYGHFNDKG